MGMFMWASHFYLLINFGWYSFHLMLDIYVLGEYVWGNHLASIVALLEISRHFGVQLIWLDRLNFQGNFQVTLKVSWKYLLPLSQMPTLLSVFNITPFSWNLLIDFDCKKIMKLTDEKRKKMLRIKEIHPMRQKVGKRQILCCFSAPEVF